MYLLKNSDKAGNKQNLQSGIANTMQTKQRGISFAPPVTQYRTGDTAPGLIADTHVHPQTTPFGAAQLKPIGTYLNAPPNAAKGTFNDTLTLAAHRGSNVPARVIAVMKEPGYGGVPSVDPPGWSWLRQKFGKLKGKWVRFHIINAKLGGAGNNTSNLVPTTPAVNTNQAWGNLETRAKDSATTDKDWTYVDVAITYDNAYPAGIPRAINANWGYYNDDDDEWVKVGGDVALSQVNPDDNTGSNYYLASQVTQTILKNNYRLNTKQASAIKSLISQRWSSQNELELAMLDKLDKDDSLGTNEWYFAQSKIYVDEDDTAGPYEIVVRKV